MSENPYQMPIYADESRPVEERLASAEAAMKVGDENAARWSMHLKTRMAAPTEVRTVALEAAQQPSTLGGLQAAISANQHPSQQPLTGQKMGEEPPGTIPNRSTARSGFATPGEGFGTVVSQPAPLERFPDETDDGYILRLEEEERWDQAIQAKTDALHQQTIQQQRAVLQNDTTVDGDGS